MKLLNAVHHFQYRIRRQIRIGWRRLADEFSFWLRFSGQKNIQVSTNRSELLFDISTPLGKKFLYPVFTKGFQEPGVLDILEERCKPESCFLDIGSFIGMYAIVCSKLCNKGNVHAFEMNPTLIPEIEKNVKLNNAGNVNVICTAAWEKDGQLLTFDQKKGVSTSSIITSKDTGTILIPSMMIDTYCRVKEINPDIVKIDVEGAELKVLLGMANTIKTIQNLLLEVHPEWIVGGNLVDIEKLLKKSGFRFAIIKEHRTKKYQVLPVSDLRDIKSNTMLLCSREN